MRSLDVNSSPPPPPHTSPPLSPCLQNEEDSSAVMASPGQIIRNIGPKLVPFFKTVAIYFVVLLPIDKPTIWAVLVKCAPVYSLMFFVLMHGISSHEKHTFNRHILFGLMFSSFGDALLVWPAYFLFGMCSFAVAQIFYIKAFGFKELKFYIAVPIYGIAVYILYVFWDQTTGPFRVGVPLYSFLLMTMIWRATARIKFTNNEWTWTEVCGSIGGIFFGISDGIIGFDRFSAPIPDAHFYVMITYYIAQFGIALSVVDSGPKYRQKMKLEAKAERSSNKVDGSIKSK